MGPQKWEQDGGGYAITILAIQLIEADENLGVDEVRV